MSSQGSSKSALELSHTWLSAEKIYIVTEKI